LGFLSLLDLWCDDDLCDDEDDLWCEALSDFSDLSDLLVDYNTLAHTHKQTNIHWQVSSDGCRDSQVLQRRTEISRDGDWCAMDDVSTTINKGLCVHGSGYLNECR
jgi:hypothetical protein